jgi:hypothetical protein
MAEMAPINVEMTLRVADGASGVMRDIEDALMEHFSVRYVGKALRHLAGGESAWAFLMPEHIEKGAAWAGY